MATIPTWWDRSKVGTLFKPRLELVTASAYAAGLRPAVEDKRKVALINIDNQVDFVHLDGSLSVPGAVGDVTRLCEWIFANAEKITSIISSLDSHMGRQIFFSTWWADANGNHPAPGTMITVADTINGTWRPLIDPAWSLEYVKLLDSQSKKVLIIWPFHTMIGTPGQGLDPALFEVIHWHAIARHSQPVFIQKGMIPQTEHYSPFEPEVQVKKHPLGGRQDAVLDQIEKHDAIYIAGEAKSHCVLEAGASMMRYYGNKPDVIKRLRFLGDCMSSVVVPPSAANPNPPDFEAIANAEIATWQAKGLQVVSSTQPVTV